MKAYIRVTVIAAPRQLSISTISELRQSTTALGRQRPTTTGSNQPIADLRQGRHFLTDEFEQTATGWHIIVIYVIERNLNIAFYQYMNFL
jgi:hypothetical protein